MRFPLEWNSSNPRSKFTICKANGGGTGRASVKLNFDEDYIAAQLRGEGLDRKMVPSDFEQVRVLGKGGYGTVLLVRHKVSGRLFAQKQLKKASLVVQTKIVGMASTKSCGF